MMRSLTAAALAVVIGALCYYLHSILVNHVPRDEPVALDVHNAGGMRLEEAYPKDDPVYPKDAIVTQEMINRFSADGVRKLRFRPADPVPYAMYLQFGIPVLLFLIGGCFIYVAVNKERFADFLIATESEMKKVSWSSKQELIGSTAVVLVTVILLAILIYVADLLVIKGLSGLGAY